MSFEDLVQLLILAGAGLAWLLGSAKTKKAPPRRPPRPPRPPTRPEVWEVKLPQPPVRVPERRPADSMAEEIYRILSGEVEERDREESLEVLREEAAPSRESLEEIREAEAYSLETLEPAGEASHRRFREKYLVPTPPPVSVPARATGPGTERAARRSVPALGTGSLREAMLWHEILGPPKAFKD